MGFITFMQSTTGRLLRIVAGALLVWYGMTQMAGAGAVLLALIGMVPIAAGVFNFCLLAPLFGLSLLGHRPVLK